MKRAIFHRFGRASEVVELLEVEAPAPASGEALVAVRFAPINPADLLLVTGQHAFKPKLPAFVGIEGAGFVEALGSGVSHLEVGDLVALPSGGTWSERVMLPADALTALPKNLPLEQAAMLSVNPVTVLCLLERFADLRPDDWVVQNAANSAVGRLLIRLAKARGIRTVNLVRRETVVAKLQQLGADVVLVGEDNLKERISRATGGAAIHLALDAIAGTSAGSLVDCLEPGGTLVTYGLLSGEAIQVPTARIVFEGITVRGFTRLRAITEMPRETRNTMLLELAELVANGSLTSEIDAVYPLTQVKRALEHAEASGRGGKILLELNL